MITSNGYI